jgi:hypothetical protein
MATKKTIESYEAMTARHDRQAKERDERTEQQMERFLNGMQEAARGAAVRPTDINGMAWDIYVALATRYGIRNDGEHARLSANVAFEAAEAFIARRDRAQPTPRSVHANTAKGRKNSSTRRR